MKQGTRFASIVAMLPLLFTASVGAATIDFIELTEMSGGLGESSWSTLSATDHVDLNYFGISITGHATDDTAFNDNSNDLKQFAYLDWGNAGLGVCKDATPSGANPDNRSNSCLPSSDDNVTTNEYLEFLFDQDVVIENLWFNNNHDGGFDSGDKVDIGIDMNLSGYAVMTGYAGDNKGIGSFLVKQGEKLLINRNGIKETISFLRQKVGGDMKVDAAIVLGTGFAGDGACSAGTEHGCQPRRNRRHRYCVGRLAQGCGYASSRCRGAGRCVFPAVERAGIVAASVVDSDIGAGWIGCV